MTAPFVAVVGSERGIGPLPRSGGLLVDVVVHTATCPSFRGHDPVGTAGVYVLPEVLAADLPAYRYCRRCLHDLGVERVR